MVRGKSIYHCTGKKRGTKFRTYSSPKKAREVHRAIQARKHSRRSGRSG